MINRKGISLPIETIVIIALAVLVMVVVVVFFVSGSSKQLNAMSDQQALTQGCTDLVIRYNCDINSVGQVKISGYNGDCGGLKGDTLNVACCKAGYLSASDCKVQACRCPS